MPRPRTALPRTDPLDAKDRNARRQGLGPRTQAQVFSRKKFFFRRSQKKFFKKILLVLELRSRGFYVQAYADDLAVLVTGAIVLWLRGMAQNWALEQEVQTSNKKTEIVLFTHKRNPDLGSLSMNGPKLELSKEARLLGVTLDSKLTCKPHLNQIARKATTALMQCRQIVGKTLEINPSMMKWIYTDMIRPIMSYTCVSWAGGLNKKYLVRKLTKMQRLARLMISSAFPGTPLVLWKYCSTLLPLRNFCWLRQCRVIQNHS